MIYRFHERATHTSRRFHQLGSESIEYARSETGSRIPMTAFFILENDAVEEQDGFYTRVEELCATIPSSDFVDGTNKFFPKVGDRVTRTKTGEVFVVVDGGRESHYCYTTMEREYIQLFFVRETRETT